MLELNQTPTPTDKCYSLLELVVREKECLLVVLGLPGLDLLLVPGVGDVDEVGGGGSQHHAAGHDRGLWAWIGRDGDRGHLCNIVSILYMIQTSQRVVHGKDTEKVTPNKDKRRSQEKISVLNTPN